MKSQGRKTVQFALLTFIVLAATAIAFAQISYSLRFERAIGVIPVTGVAANGTVNVNVVRGVNPGGPWTIGKFEANVDTSTGRIKAQGRHLLLAAGNGIGTNAGQSVHATLFCGPVQTATAHNSTLAGVKLDDEGNFEINDTLDPLPPQICETPVLLIRNVGGVWFAAGVLDQDADRRHD